MSAVETKIEEYKAKLVEMGEGDEWSDLGVMEVQAAVCAAYGIAYDDLMTEKRTQRSVNARQACFQICREYKKLTLYAIASAFEKDHGTVLHGLRSFQSRFEGDADFRKGYERALLALGILVKNVE